MKKETKKEELSINNLELPLEGLGNENLKIIVEKLNEVINFINEHK